MILPPLTFLMMWSLFLFCGNHIIALSTLLASSIILPWMFMDYCKVFWPCGLLLILMSTGLIVIFAYIVSLHGGGVVQWKPGSLTAILFSLLCFSLYKDAKKVCSMHYVPVVEPLLSVLLISVLLYLVVSFIRLTYSKGGGFRKKF